jgi:hypothetical protein
MDQLPNLAYWIKHKGKRGGREGGCRKEGKEKRERNTNCFGKKKKKG